MAVIQKLDIGSRAPNFSLPADGGQTLALSDFAGKNLVLYFYPKDDTPGCTTQALDFSAKRAEFAALNTEIIGISADSVKKHDTFKAKHNLSITLLSDENQQILKKYGVWVEKKLYGRAFMGIERTTFFIDKAGIIQHIWRKVRVKNHVGEVLDMVSKLS